MDGTKTKPGSLSIDKLKEDYMLKFPSTDVHSANIIFMYIDMAYCLGYDEHRHMFNGKSKRVIKDDGTEYSSIYDAARKNNIDQRNIRRAIKEKRKTKGHYYETIEF